MTKMQMTETHTSWFRFEFRISDFGFVSDFDIRISDLLGFGFF